MTPPPSKLLLMRRREKKIRLLAVETVKEMVLLLKRIKMRRRTRQRVRIHQRKLLLQEKVRKAPPSELLMVRIHQITDSIYMHVSRTKFGMVMQIHRK
jgi:hypothetical protein